MDKARKGAVSQDYEGPDGDVLATFDKIGEGTKDGVAWRTVEFRVAEEGEFNGKRLSRYFSFEDTQWRTKQETLGDFFQCFIDMGLDAENLTDEEITEALKAFKADGTLFTLRVKRNKKGYINFYINGQADDQSSSDQSGAEAAPADEAADEDEAEAAEGDGDGEAVVKPSDWDGQEVSYTTGKGPKKKTVQAWVANCDDDARTIDLVNENGETIVEGIDFESEAITWPE